MKRIPFLLSTTLALAVAVPMWAQTPIAAPAGWTSQARANGATQFTPSDLQNGEVYNVTTYDSAPLGSKTLAEHLRAFAGPVGKKVGHLVAPLQVKVADARIASGSGTYAGPKGAVFDVVFIAVSLDGENVHVSRTLASRANGLAARYQEANNTLTGALVDRAKREAGRNVVVVPRAVTQKLKPGGALVPGVYAGNQFRGDELSRRFRVYLYANGEYRVTDENDADIKETYGTVMGTGRYKYNRQNGQLEIDPYFDMSNESDYAEDFCLYGRNSAGKPVIYAEKGLASITVRTSLVYVGPPTKRLSKSAQDARDSAIEAEKNRYKWVTAPGRGVKPSQIAAVWHRQTYADGTAKGEAWLLLRDGTIYNGLPVAPDQLDLVRSRRNEPQKWGRWRIQNGKYQVSWGGKPYQTLQGSKGIPGGAQTRLNARYGNASSYFDGITGTFSYWGVTFDQAGRFKKDERGGGSVNDAGGGSGVITAYDDEGASAVGPGISVIRKKNPNGSREGTYTINGYSLTLRYDNGKVVRLPFFFSDAARKQVWFEGDLLSLGFDK